MPLRTPPTCSVITSTWQRHDALLKRAIPSVLAQTYPDVRHVIASDGPDDYLADLLPQHPSQRYVQLPEHDAAKHWGAAARRAALDLCDSDYVTYVDDDDALRPEHVSLLAAALEASPDAGFAVSRMVSHLPPGPTVIGHSGIGYGQLGTPMLMHRREILGVATWGEPSACEDWELVAAWIGAGVTYVSVDADTCDVYPSAYGVNL